MTVVEAKEKWEIDKALEKINHVVERQAGLDRYEAMEHWKSIVAYIGILELQVEADRRKENA